MVTVIYGSNEENLEGFAGKTVGQLRSAFGLIGVGAEDAATVNGENVSDDAILEDGDELKFVKATAQKG